MLSFQNTTRQHESTMEPPGGFEAGTPRMLDKVINHIGRLKMLTDKKDFSFSKHRENENKTFTEHGTEAK